MAKDLCNKDGFIWNKKVIAKITKYIFLLSGANYFIAKAN